MMLAEIEKLLRDTIGLEVETIGVSAVQYALKQRMLATGAASPQDYWHLLTGSAAELQQLINAVIVPETWFFRDREAFAVMARHARSHRRAGSPVRILSVPCSTGEEPYSIVMEMFDAGFSSADLTVDALDISTHNIAEAQRAVYGRNSFRGTDLGYRDRYFGPVEGGFRPNSQILSRVRFRTGNILDGGGAAGEEAYDVVFCRNLLIYFDRETQERALRSLWRMLVPDGLLLVGPAESSLPLQHGFASIRAPRAFALRKVDIARPTEAVPPGLKPAKPAIRPRPLPAKSLPPADGKPGPTARRAAELTKPPEAPAQDPARMSLDAIASAANLGRLAEAKSAARSHIAKFGASSEAFYLLGLAHDADNALAAAVENYRKALYLAPDHRETLAHLVLALQRQGDLAGARILNERLGRIEKGSETR